MKLRRAIGFLLSLSLAFSLAACGSDAPAQLSHWFEKEAAPVPSDDAGDTTTAPLEETTRPVTVPETEPATVPETEPATEPEPVQTQPAPAKPTEPQGQPKASLHNYHDSYFFNDTNSVMDPGKVSVRPRYVYYDGDNLVAECFVINGTNNTVYNISVKELKFSNGFGLKCSGKFGALEDAAIAPGSYIVWTFVFLPDAISSYNRLEFLDCHSNVSFDSQTAVDY